MGKRKQAKQMVQNIEIGFSFCFKTECVNCKFYDECTDQEWTTIKLGEGKKERYDVIKKYLIKYLKEHSKEHPDKLKKLPYSMFRKIMSAFDVEDSWTPAQNIAWINEQIKEFGYEVRE